MKQIKPYRTVSGAARALDNGGRFYNVFTAAGDEVVSKTELKKAAGGRAAWPVAILYFEMSILALSASEQSQLAQMLDPDLIELRRKHVPATVSPEDFANVAAQLKDQTAIVAGRAQHVKDVSRYGGMIMIPIIAGSVTSFMTIPITEQFDVFKVTDHDSSSDEGAHIAVPKKHPPLEGRVVRFGGTVKQFEESETDEPGQYYLEAPYYTRIDE